MTRRRIVALGAVLAGLVVAQAAQAQTYPPPPPPGSGPPPPGGYYAPPAAPEPTVHRDGFMLGFSLGGGAMSPDCEGPGCESLEGPAISFHFGGMLNQRLALMGDFSGVMHQFEDGTSFFHSVVAFAAQFWIMEQFWIKGGIAAGRLSLQDADGDEFAANESGGGLMGAVGFEVLQSRNFTLDIQARAASIHYSDGDFNMSNFSLNVGVNWF